MISVHCDVSGKTVTLDSHGKSITWSRTDAQQVADYLNYALMQLRHDDTAKQQVERIKEKYK